MVKVTAEMRNEVIALGRWGDFVAACERMEKEGGKGTKLIDDAIDEVCPELSRFKRRKLVKRVSVKRGVGDGRCNGYRMLEWVVENFEDESVSEEDAPSRASWSILKASRRDEDTYRDVLKKYMDSKLKLDASNGDTETRKFDGQAEYDILNGLEIGELK